MGFFRREKQAALPVQTGSAVPPVLTGCAAVGGGAGERALYRALREQVPIIDAAILKLVRLIGGFRVACPERRAEDALAAFLREVPVNGMSGGVESFLAAYFDQLLTYGTAVGEIVVNGGRVAALYNASLDDVELRAVTPLTVEVLRATAEGMRPCRYPELILCSALHPEPGRTGGVSILRGLPFVSEVLLKIYRTIGVNWERMGNVRFAVTCKNDGYGSAADRAQSLAREWSRAMRRDTVSDFVAVGDVKIEAIGAGGEQMESDVPVRQMLEQIVAKLGVPPFLLGLSWSSTERMSSQQADVLTSELMAYRRVLEPVILKICRTWLGLAGFSSEAEVVWDEITMQDEVDHANAEYLAARTEALRQKGA